MHFEYCRGYCIDPKKVKELKHLIDNIGINQIVHLKRRITNRYL